MYSPRGRFKRKGLISEDPLIEIEVIDLDVKFVMRRTGDALFALKDFTLSIEPEKFVCVIGPSGCGKTSLLNVLAGLHHPERGQVLMNGKQIEGPGIDRAMVFQTSALLPWRTVLQNISYGLELQNVSRKAAVQHARAMCSLVGLSGFMDSYPRELSGGMQQRVNLARALATNPKLLLMDEPFASLDAQTRDQMQDEILRIWRQTRQTVIFVTHQIEEAVFLADEVVVITARPGKVKTTIKIELPRPRTFDVKKTPVFHGYVDQLRDLVYQEFLAQERDGRYAE